MASPKATKSSSSISSSSTSTSSATISMSSSSSSSLEESESPAMEPCMRTLGKGWSPPSLLCVSLSLSDMCSSPSMPCCPWAEPTSSMSTEFSVPMLARSKEAASACPSACTTSTSTPMAKSSFTPAASFTTTFEVASAVPLVAAVSPSAAAFHSLAPASKVRVRPLEPWYDSSARTDASHRSTTSIQDFIAAEGSGPPISLTIKRPSS
mmetsp:Transcript_40840/g.123061  ORF Transcript_40840/g.123061 Transcript_40840/m.123061 type:complete len:209 (-) Transcript_40840:3025-3651(-)